MQEKLRRRNWPKATATVEELNQLKQELQATVDDVQADLKVADDRTVKIGALEKNAADLKDEIEGKTGELDSLRDELDSRNEALAELETRLEESQAEVRFGATAHHCSEGSGRTGGNRKGLG